MKNRCLHGWKLVLLFSLSLLLSGCLSDTSYAPVVNAQHQPTSNPAVYAVRKGDTVYSIAWTFGLDYRSLAAANGLNPPYAIHPGQRLRVQGLPWKSYAERKSERRSRHSNQKKVVKVYGGGKPWDANKEPVVVKQQHQIWRNKPVTQWRWPARGRIVQGFSPSLAGNHGIDIAGRLGEPVHAAASGTVVYSGDGVRGYGNLLIIKHNDSYLSAYAFNKKLLVKLGQQVWSGQTIATMGRNNAGRTMLHFEIRHNGRPVNPKRYLHS